MAENRNTKIPQDNELIIEHMLTKATVTISIREYEKIKTLVKKQQNDLKEAMINIERLERIMALPCVVDALHKE